MSQESSPPLIGLLNLNTGGEELDEKKRSKRGGKKQIMVLKITSIQPIEQGLSLFFGFVVFHFLFIM